MRYGNEHFGSIRMFNFFNEKHCDPLISKHKVLNPCFLCPKVIVAINTSFEILLEGPLNVILHDEN